MNDIRLVNAADNVHSSPRTVVKESLDGKLPAASADKKMLG